jgi:hypothetical protein
MKHTNTLKGVRVFTAQPNESKPHKTYGHKVAELQFTNERGESESTYVDPTNENNSLWLDVLEQFATYRPCEIALEYPEGVRYFNKARGIINADLKGVKPVVTGVYDNRTGESKSHRVDPKTILFE